MKLSLALLALSYAADSERPVISLDLGHKTGGNYSLYKVSDRRYDSSTPRFQASVKNAFADECDVNTPFFSITHKGQTVMNVTAVDNKCKQPRAAAYDHHEGDISSRLTTTYTLFVESNRLQMPTRPGDAVGSFGNSDSSGIDFSQRGEFVINYDVTDAAGNSAERVEFAIILRDEKAPFFYNSPAYYARETIEPYTSEAAHCGSNAECATTASNRQSYRTYFRDQFTNSGGAVVTEDHTVLELCGDLGSPAVAAGTPKSQVKNLYWNDPEFPIGAYDEYDGLLNVDNSVMSVTGMLHQHHVAVLPYKIDMFYYLNIDDHFSTLDHPNAAAEVDMTYPIPAAAGQCLNEMKTGKNSAGQTMFTESSTEVTAWMEGSTERLAGMDLTTCNFEALMAQYQLSSATQNERSTLRDQCVRCVGAYREYITDSRDTKNFNRIIQGGDANGSAYYFADGHKYAGGATSSTIKSDCWGGMQSHQFENWFCGKPLRKWEDYSLEANDFADVFGLNNQNNVVVESGSVFFQDSIVPTITLPVTKDENGNNVNYVEYECGYAISANEGQLMCTFAGTEKCTEGNTGCTSNQVCQAGVCNNVGFVNSAGVCEGAADGNSTYVQQWMAKDPAAPEGHQWTMSYRPKLKYEDCYDTHAKAQNWVKIFDGQNPALDLDKTSANWAGVEGQCKAQTTTIVSGEEVTVDVLPNPFADDVATPSTHYQSLWNQLVVSGNSTLFSKCVTRCERQVARTSGYASGSTSHTNGCNGYCAMVAEYDGFECHSKAQSIPLSYNVQDNFGNWAVTKHSHISIVDSIAPSLYITTHSYRQATGDLDSVKCDDVKDQPRLIYPNGTMVDNQTAFGIGKHWVMQHCDNARFCEISGQIHSGAACNGTTLHGQYNLDNMDTHNLTVQNGAARIDSRTGNQLLDQDIIQHSAGYAGDYRFVEELLMEGIGYQCHDRCSATTTSVEWHSSCDSNTKIDFDILNPGTYYLKYSCNDAAGQVWNKAGTALVDRPSMVTTACRTFINVDKTKPVLTIFDYANNADGFYHVEATRDNNYVDAGAACSDMVDGNLNPDVEVSGDVVNMAAVGTYVIEYNCEDSAGHSAIPAHRTVIVEDTTCPTCSIPGDEPIITVEASFPYTEAGSVCTDSIDGFIGDAKVFGTVDIEKTGTYVLTYTATDMNNNGFGVSGLSCVTNNAHTTKTVVVEDTMVPIISLKYRSHQLLGASLMADASTTQTWMIGAIASAISGVAILGYAATRKNTVSTTVPV
jgi:hypothetical protein